MSTRSREDQCKTKGTARKVRPPAAAAVLSRVIAWSVAEIRPATTMVEASEMTRPYRNSGPKIHTKGAWSNTKSGG